VLRGRFRGLLAAAVVVAAGAVVGAGAAAATTSLVGVEPENGATLARPPERVVLTFATDLDPAASTAVMTAPGGRPRDVVADVDGARLVVRVAPAGDGGYVVGYSVAAAGAAAGEGVVRGEVGFTVAADGVARRVGGAAPWAAVSVLAAVGMAGVLLLTVRRWQALR
jgi:methionine-rich copper-binding protein CopC